MSSGGGPPLNPSTLQDYITTLDGGGSTSIPVGLRPFKVSFVASKEHRMRANSGDGGVGIGSPYDDAPLPRFPRVLTILYN
jgi:hypothetical protein